MIDWEMATLGDPLTDLALLLVYGRLGALVGGEDVADAAEAPGLLSEQEIMERDAPTSGRSLDDFGFYPGLASYKFATIVEGIHYRHLHGQTLGSGFDGIEGPVVPLLEAGLTSLKEYS